MKDTLNIKTTSNVGTNILECICQDYTTFGWWHLILINQKPFLTIWKWHFIYIWPIIKIIPSSLIYQSGPSPPACSGSPADCGPQWRWVWGSSQSPQTEYHPAMAVHTTCRPYQSPLKTKDRLNKTTCSGLVNNFCNLMSQKLEKLN